MTTVTTHSTRNGSTTRATAKDTNPTRVMGVLTDKGVRQAKKAAAKKSEKLGNELAKAAKAHSAKMEEPVQKVVAAVNKLEKDAKAVQADAKAVKAAAKKAKAEPKAPRAKPAVDPDSVTVTRDMVVHMLTKTNPKSGKRAERFALYTHGMTVAEYVKAGGKLRDVRWDVAHGWVSVK